MLVMDLETKTKKPKRIKTNKKGALIITKNV